uniref:ATP binding protein n=1 Tax=Solanum tuberosum TaxID=4113 RepID=M1DW68_SOLTU
MGTIGTGKSRLSVDLATHFRGEIINSDKMQVYKGLEIVTNKITHAEKQGVRHYLLGEIEPDSNFTAKDFCLKSNIYIETILKAQCVPIIVGGLNSYIEKLVEDPEFMFKHKYYGCFIWIDVEQSVLNSRVDTRVNEMVNAGLVDEVRQIFIPDADYTKGIRLTIGVPEMAKYLMEEKNIDGDDESKKMILQASISSIKREIVPDSNFTAKDFCLKSNIYIETILKAQFVPIIVGGSNSYIEILVEDPVFMFKHKYYGCIIWIDVEQSVLNSRVDTRVDEMVNADYTTGIRLSIGVPEIAKYLMQEKNIDGDDESKKMILQASISSIKRNTRILICNQLDKIQRLINEKMWSVHHIIATDVFKENRKEVVDEAWRMSHPKSGCDGTCPFPTGHVSLTQPQLYRSRNMRIKDNK